MNKVHRSTFLLACVCVAAAPLVHARQDRTEASRKEEIHRKIAEMRKQMQEGTLLKLNVQVLVRLKNDEKIQGVVKEGRFVERPEGLDFAETDRAVKGAGIRIWYYDNTTSFMFLPYGQIESYTIIRRLTDIEVKEIAEKMEEEERKAKEGEARRRVVQAEQSAKAKEDRLLEGKLEKATKGEDDADARKKEEDKASAILAEFPPEAGWGPAKLRDIQMKKITIGVFPDEKTKKFVDCYEQWKAAYEARIAAEEKKESARKGSEKESEKDKEKSAENGGGSRG